MATPIQLNNQLMMGEYDLDKLGGLIVELDNEDLGFTNNELTIMFDGDDRFTKLFSEEVDKTKDTLRDIKKNREEMIERYKENQSASFYFIVVCENAEQKKQVLAEIGIPEYEEYVAAEVLQRFKKKHGEVCPQ